MPSSTSESSDSLNVPSSSSYFSYPVKYAVSSAWRRFSSENTSSKQTSKLSPKPSSEKFSDDSLIRTPSPRSIAPFQPPPLSALRLTGYRSNTPSTAQLLSRLLAEEIRLLVPTRLQLVEDWNLVFSLEQDGASLSTLYEKCDKLRGKRGAFVLVVKDGSGNIFGSYLNEAPRPSNGHYYGNGECFLWRASILPSLPTLASLPPPPSEDTTNAQRMTTVGSAKSSRRPKSKLGNGSMDSQSGTGASTPERIRFKAFPYSGVNDYMIFCEHGFLSVGGGDGHYGLWVNESLENGVSESCPTFGNEPLSDEGKKFEVIGVEIWFIGA